MAQIADQRSLLRAVYGIISVPVAWFADRGQSRPGRVARLWRCGARRPRACGLAGSFGQLAAARMAVGVGEAGACRPPMPSSPIISAPTPGALHSGCTIWGRRSVTPWGSRSVASIAAAYSWRDAFIVLGVSACSSRCSCL